MDYKYINPEYIESVAGDDKEAIKEIVEIFREQVSEISAEMKELYEASDYYNLGLLAHKAKSSVAIMGMENLASMLKTFELQAKEGLEKEKYITYISDFEHDTAEAIVELDNYIKSINETNR
ncbi:MAG: Hpt domain-containing protein [Bacteroidales bacterium]